MKKAILLAGIVSILALAIIGCGNPAGGGGGGGNGGGNEVNRTALQNAIAGAEALLAATYQSPNGADVHLDKYWTNAEQRLTFQNAIAAARAVLANDAATQAEVDA